VAVAPPVRFSPWPHRLAVALALVTFPLIWVGGLVTTYDAGMAVPDWPGTYGENLFLFSWQKWLAGSWDLFIEHGHRLLGATAGLVAIALAIVTFLTDRRRSVQALAAGALLLVILQGVLGGARVLLDERLVALVHGCVGPLFFAYLAGLIVVTSRWWTEAEAPKLDPAVIRSLLIAAWFTAGLAFLQLALGAVVRHVPLTSSPTVFRATLLLHLIVAGVLCVQLGISSWKAWSVRQSAPSLTFPSLALPTLLLVQLGLGIATYVAKYSWPAWLADYSFAAGHVVQEKSLLQSMTVTAHVANGSLILFLAALLAVRVSRISVLRTLYSVLGSQPVSARPAVPSRFSVTVPAA
jgi:cytochrome c oxidase assembly protein subunit 15